MPSTPCHLETTIQQRVFEERVVRIDSTKCNVVNGLHEALLYLTEARQRCILPPDVHCT